MNINELLATPKRENSRRPDYILKVLNKATDQRTGKIGAAWQNNDGSISLVLDLGVTFHQEPNLVIMLFPNDRETTVTKAKGKRGGPTSMADLPTSLIHKIQED